MPSEAFLRGILKRAPGIGLSATLVFKSSTEPRDAMARLESARRSGVLTTDKSDNLLILAIHTSGEWDGGRNRRIGVLLRRTEDIGQFMHLAEQLETIELKREHPLKVLQTGRQRKREEAFKQILTTWISPEIRSALSEWGFVSSAQMIEEEGGFHILKIIFQGETEVIETYYFDGWSGCMGFGQSIIWLVQRLATPEEFERRVLRDIEEFLEELTA
ncbi:hypothetical protein HQ487_01085 [Candidatus Uhrbacteria bacterium]|nr:hypothetical protein [Candidatus Uhrbacteria bacterium]